MAPVTTVDDYIAAQSAELQPRLRELRVAIRGAAPQATEVIAYGMPTYKLNGRSVHFGAAKHHCSLYGTPMDDFATELQGFKTLRGTVQFRLDRPVPDTLVRKLVAAKLGGSPAKA